MSDVERAIEKLRTQLTTGTPASVAANTAEINFSFDQNERRRGPLVFAGVSHSADFRSVNWFGMEYSFTPNQAAIVSLLYEAWANKTPDVSADYLVTEADIQATDTRLSVIFRGSDAWGTMIVPGKTKGTYRLQEPTPKKSSARPKMRS